MISSKSIDSGAGAATYFDKAFQQDGEGRAADNYYLNEQAVASWHGKGSELIGLADAEVRREDFVALLDGKMPLPGSGKVQDLRDNAVGDKRRAGIDFTISAPKSVSVTALLGRDERVIAAHQVASDAAMRWLERNASVVRVRDGIGGSPAPKQAGNLIWASVTHETDRSNMPQLHTHNVIVSAVYDQDDKKWRSLTNDELLVLRRSGDVVYKRELAQQLQAAGYDLISNKNGVDFEIRGFSAEQLAAFAPRSEAIDAVLRERGIDPATAGYEARQAATLASRESKVDLPRDVLHERWADTERKSGLDVKSLVEAATLKQAEARTAAPELDANPSTAALRAVVWAVEHHAEREQAFRSSDVAITAMKFAPSLSVGAAEAAIDRLKRDGVLVDRGLTPQGGRLVTTPRGRSVELMLAENLAASRGRSNVIVSTQREFDARLATFEARESTERGEQFKLSAEQLNAAKNALMHRDAIQGIQGEAGTGKTAALAFVREVAESKGWKVLGMATSSSAATELGKASGMDSSTLASFRAKQEIQIRSVRNEILQLTRTISQQRVEGLPKGALVEYRRLDLGSSGHEAASRAYSFDHKRGVVYRMNGGLFGTAGLRLLDLAQSVNDRNLTRQQSPKVTTVEKVLGRSMSLGGQIVERVGVLLSDFEKVAGAQAVFARVALAAEESQPEQRIARALGQKRAELRNLEKYGDRAGRQTLLVMDETSMTGAADLAELTLLARDMSARTVLQGDTKQHGSPAAGRAFAQAQSFGMHTSVLRETMRFKNATDQVKEAHALMQDGKFGLAYAKLDTVAVHPNDLARKVAERYVELLKELKAARLEPGMIGVPAMTNADRKAANVEIHRSLQAADFIGKADFQKIHLDRLKLTRAEHHFASSLSAAGTTHLGVTKRLVGLQVRSGSVLEVIGFDVAKNTIRVVTSAGRELTINPNKHESFNALRLEERNYSAGDRVEARDVIRTNGQRRSRIANGTQGRIESIDTGGMVVAWDDGRKLALNNDQVKSVDHAYARTTFKEQGATNQKEVVMVSETGAKIFNREAAYVAATRAKVNTEVFTSDRQLMLGRADASVAKETALTNAEIRSLVAEGRVARNPQNAPKVQVQRATQIQELTRD